MNIFNLTAADREEIKKTWIKEFSRDSDGDGITYISPTGEIAYREITLADGSKSDFFMNLGAIRKQAAKE